MNLINNFFNLFNLIFDILFNNLIILFPFILLFFMYLHNHHYLIVLFSFLYIGVVGGTIELLAAFTVFVILFLLFTVFNKFLNNFLNDTTALTSSYKKRRKIL